MLNTRGMDGNARGQAGPPVSAPSQNPASDFNTQRGLYSTGVGGHELVPRNRSLPTGWGTVEVAAYSGYYQPPAAAFSPAMPHKTTSYHSEYEQVTPQAHDIRAHPSPIYNAPQMRVQSTVYDTNQLFPLWQSTALRRPTDTVASYFLNEPASTGTAPTLPAQAISSGASKADSPGPAEESAVLDVQGSDVPTSGMSPASEPPEEQDYPTSTEMDEAYEQYQKTIKEGFTNIRNGVLASASESLLAVSDWLLSKVTELGMSEDCLYANGTPADNRLSRSGYR